MKNNEGGRGEMFIYIYIFVFGTNRILGESVDEKERGPGAGIAEMNVDIWEPDALVLP